MWKKSRSSQEIESVYQVCDHAAAFWKVTWGTAVHNEPQWTLDPAFTRVFQEPDLLCLTPASPWCLYYPSLRRFPGPYPHGTLKSF